MDYSFKVGISTIWYDKEDEFYAKKIKSFISSGISYIESYFGQKYQRNFQVYVHKNRKDLDYQWQEMWGGPEFQSECWMVASGVSSRLDLLSPRVWDKEACEHDKYDFTAMKRLIHHELVHIYHGQNNPSQDFDGIVDLDWFIEGLAVLISGQLHKARRVDVQNFLAEDDESLQLDMIWKGKHKYGLAGSLVWYIEQEWGKSKLFEFLKFTTADEILNSLEITEEILISQWKSSVLTMLL